MAGVKPLAAAKPPPAAPKPRAIARFSRSGPAALLLETRQRPFDPGAADDAGFVAFKRPGVRDESLRRLRRGQIPVEGEIDLHGLARHAAHDALRAFLGMAIERRLRCVRVIHGKGLRSGSGGAVLKHGVNDWLSRIECVAAFASARPADGGTGAVYVLLRLPAGSSTRDTL
jgi:DNA-nicking Smr family endonuclease